MSTHFYMNMNTPLVTLPWLPRQGKQAETLLPIQVREKLLITLPTGERGQVIRPFLLTVSREAGGYLVTSSIADLYEFEETVSEAVSKYLRSLVDELLWFQNSGEQFSPHLLDIYEKLRLYVQLV